MEKYFSERFLKAVDLEILQSFDRWLKPAFKYLQAKNMARASVK